MRKNYYVLDNGKLKREENTILLETEEEKKRIPVKNANSLHIMSQTDFNTRFFSFLSQEQIPAHYYNWFDRYTGSFYPTEYLNSGKVLVKQVLTYDKDEKRMKIAKEIVKGASKNMLSNLKYYKRKNKDVKNIIQEIKDLRSNISEVENFNKLRGIEGKIRKTYYRSFSKITRNTFEYHKRTKRPPKNEINALISFGNSLLYSTTLTEIYRTQLNPTISFLHEPRERRFSLSLDLSEIFKPLIVDKTMFKLINKQIIKPNDFNLDMNKCLLNEEGKKKYIKEYESKLEKTTKHNKLNKNVSYQRLIRLEAYKLVKHVLGDKNYKSYTE